MKPITNHKVSVTRNIAEGLKMHFPNSFEINEADDLTLIFGNMKLIFDVTGSLIGVDCMPKTEESTKDEHLVAHNNENMTDKTVCGS